MTIDELRRLANAGTWKHTQHAYSRTTKLLISESDAAKLHTVALAIIQLDELIESPAFHDRLTDRIVEAWLYAPDTWEHVAEVVADWLRAEIRKAIA